MTPHEKPTSKLDHHQSSPTQGEATSKFVEKLRKIEAYNAPKNPDEYTDEQATALLDLPEAVEAGDVVTTQSILEDRFSSRSYKSMKVDRLKALAELRTAEKGEITPEESAESFIEVQRAIMQFSHPEFTDKDRLELMDGRFGSIEQREKVIDFIEDRIADLGVFTDDPEKMKQRDLLRIGRDKMAEQYIGLKEFEDEEARTKKAKERKQDTANIQRKTADLARAEIATIYGEDKAPEVSEPVQTYTHQEMVDMGLRPEAPQSVAKVTNTPPPSDKEILGKGLSPEEIAERDREAAEARERIAARRAEREQVPEKVEEPTPTPVRPAIEQARQEVAAIVEPEKQDSPQQETEEDLVQETKKPSQETKEALQKDAEKRNKLSALSYGLQAINNLPPDTRHILFGKHNVSELLQPLGELQNKVNLDKFDTKVVDQLHRQLQAHGIDPRRRSAIWQEVGRPSRSDMGRVAQQIERALVPFLQHLNEVTKNDQRT